MMFGDCIPSCLQGKVNSGLFWRHGCHSEGQERMEIIQGSPAQRFAPVPGFELGFCIPNRLSVPLCLPWLLPKFASHMDGPGTDTCSRLGKEGPAPPNCSPRGARVGRGLVPLEPSAGQSKTTTLVHRATMRADKPR